MHYKEKNMKIVHQPSDNIAIFIQGTCFNPLNKLSKVDALIINLCDVEGESSSLAHYIALKLP